MAEARSGCIAIIQWIWIQLKRPFSHMVDDSPDTRGLVDIDASGTPPRFPEIVPLNQETTVCIPVATAGPSSSNHQIISRPSQLNIHPSSSSCLPFPSIDIPTCRKYDVFLNFRGPDTRKGFTKDLRDQLQARGITAFMDDLDHQDWETVSPTHIAAIQESKLAVVVFSRDYASSTWCLEELVKIVECWKKLSLPQICPIYYHVDPADIRYQKLRFKEAFSKHKTSGRHNPETVRNWRVALREVANLSGWFDVIDFKTDRECIYAIVEHVTRRLGYACFETEAPWYAIDSTHGFHAYEGTTKAMDEIAKKLRYEHVSSVGVYDMGNDGKITTTSHEDCTASQVTDLLSYRVDNLPDSQVQVDMEASESAQDLSTVVPSNQDALMSNTLGPCISNNNIIYKTIQLKSHHSPSMCLSSSTTTPTRWKYDVFINFRGHDTRKGIAVDIRDRLQSRGIRTFMDDPDLQLGDTISDKLAEAIEGSRFAVAVLSEKYAYSTWCLEELVKICECMPSKGRILPLFYNVDPNEVRHQHKGHFKEAFCKHEASGRHKLETMNKWKAALMKVSEKSGLSTNNFNTHREVVNEIVEILRKKVPLDAIEPTDDFHLYEATTKAMDEVNEMLRDDEVTILGVYGMGGVGKTTMVRHVAVQACKNGTFNHWILATISQNPNFRKIQGTLSNLLGVTLGDEEEAPRAASLQKEIMRREKLLIILDDVWDRIELSEIGIPNSKELETIYSKVLITTRIKNVCHVMECHKVTTLDILRKQDSWDFFVRKARRSFSSIAFENVARKVAGECGGLLIALITVARALGDKELWEWETAAKQLEKSMYANPDHKDHATKCVRLSYDYLKDKTYKTYLLLCCLFPEDGDIKIEDLFRYAMGIGLFKDADTLEEARDRAKTLAKHLQNSSLLLEGRDERYVKMHDVVRDVALQIAQYEHAFFVKASWKKDWPQQLHKDCYAISLMNNYISKLPENLVCPPKLQILLLNSNRIEKITETFFQIPNELRVLDLSWTNSLSVLPQSFSLLNNLQALYLDWCEDLIVDTSVLGKLIKLEILSIRKLHLEELSAELGGLTNLRMFDNTNGHIGRISPGVISKWHNLEELYIKGFGDWGSTVEGKGEGTNASFDEVTALSKLRVLEATISDAECIPKSDKFISNWIKLDITVGSLVQWTLSKRGTVSAQSLWLNLDKISRLPEWFRFKIVEIADSVGWQGWQSLIDIAVELEHGRLRGLKRLHIARERQRLTEVNPTRTWVPNKPLLENLEELILDRLDCAEICATLQFLPLGSLFNLKVLTVEKSYNWGEILLPLTTLQRLLNLEEVFVGLTNIKYLFGYEELLVSLPIKLKMVQVAECSMIRLCEGPSLPTIFQNLQDLRITDCNLEGSLFTYDVAQCLPQLDFLKLHRCPFLERIIEASNKKTILPKLKQLSLLSLPVMYYESASLDIECPSLEQFYLSDCPKFAASHLDFHSMKLVKLDRFFLRV